MSPRWPCGVRTRCSGSRPAFAPPAFRGVSSLRVHRDAGAPRSTQTPRQPGAPAGPAPADGVLPGGCGSSPWPSRPVVGRTGGVGIARTAHVRGSSRRARPPARGPAPHTCRPGSRTGRAAGGGRSCVHSRRVETRPAAGRGSAGTTQLRLVPASQGRRGGSGRFRLVTPRATFRSVSALCITGNGDGRKGRLPGEPQVTSEWGLWASPLGVSADSEVVALGRRLPHFVWLLRLFDGVWGCAASGPRCAPRPRRPRPDAGSAFSGAGVCLRPRDAGSGARLEDRLVRHVRGKRGGEGLGRGRGVRASRRPGTRAPSAASAGIGTLAAQVR